MVTKRISTCLDPVSSALVEDIVRLLKERHNDILLAVLLYGSVARGEERSLDDPYPSDIDLLAVFDTDDVLIEPYRRAIWMTIGDAHRLYLDAPREVNVMFATRTFANWDSLFIENVVRDGIILYARGPLPEPLAHLRAPAPSPIFQYFQRIDNQ